MNTWAKLVGRLSSAPPKDQAKPAPELAGLAKIASPDRAVQVLFFLLLLPLSSLCEQPNKAIQFDVFLGYDRYITDSAWFPMTIEIKNDGESFSGSVEIDDGSPSGKQLRKQKMEFPKGALKRVVIPCYATPWGYNSWDARLLDSEGNVVAEHTGLRPQLQLAAGTPLLGSIPRTPSGNPQIRQPGSSDARQRPAVARLLPALIPDNPLYLEGLTCIYLNSEKAAELAPTQADAIARWVSRGGHLVIAIEELQHVESSGWLKELVPWRLTEIRTVSHDGALQEWITGQWQAQPEPPDPGAANPHGSQQGQELRPFANLVSDPVFESRPLRVATATGASSGIVIKAGATPLMLNRSVGLGEVTVLLFSPEREPARSWTNAPVFWAKVAHVPPRKYVSSNVSSSQQHYGIWGADAVFGAILDTRQVRTLPAGLLFLLLIGYMLVIGPADYFWLKRLGRPMLTWITFPAYVVGFSCLIYLIGFKLRSGELEWNELHVVDVIHGNGMKTLRGRTYASLYSPSTRGYRFEGPSFPATFRPESGAGWRSRSSAQAVAVEQRGDSFAATGVVPVWTSQIFATDWDADAPPPCAISFSTNGSGFNIEIRNRSAKKLGVTCVRSGRLYGLGYLDAGGTLQFDSKSQAGSDLVSVQRSVFSSMQSAASGRNMAFGGRQGRFLDNWPAAVQALSIPTQASFASPPGLSLLNAASREDTAILFVWADDTSPVPPLPRFNVPRTHKQTLWRILITDYR